MTQKQDTTVSGIVQEALKGNGDILRVIVEYIVQEVLEIERDIQIGVEKHKRDDEHRLGSRNGYKPRTLNTRVGKLQLRKPEIREFAFKTMIFDKYQKSEKAIIAAVQQMLIDGVSTARVKKILKHLSPDLSVSRSSASRLAAELDPIVEAWRTAELDGRYEVIICDAVYLYVRENNKVSNRPVMISIGVDMNGRRKILGLDVFYQEDEQSWTEHLQGLKKRGLKSVALTISDAHNGLVNALSKEFSGVPHQRCMVHFERNLLSKVPSKERSYLSKAIKHIYQSPDKETAIKVADFVSDIYCECYPKIAKMLDEKLEETLTYFEFPQNYHRRIRTTNLIESLNSQIKRRARVINIFPNVDSVIRYVGCLLKEIDEEWQAGRAYIKIKKEEEKNHLMEEMLDNVERIRLKQHKIGLGDEKLLLQKI